MQHYPLTIYKASAGSGKTFTLVVEYLCLLVQNPTSHDQILAVTFTNKATEEMKMRIVSQLYGISRHLPSSNGYLSAIKQRTNMSEDEICSRCSLALHHILHHYNSFHIQTIDAFFQVVFRNMARELDLPPNLRIDLNDKEVEQRAVDELIASLSGKQQMLSWIRDYISANMQEDKGWNVVREIKKFGENIYKDFYKNHDEELHKILSNETSFNSLQKQLQELRASAFTKWKEAVNNLYNTLEKSGYNSPDYFKQGTRGSVWAYINKLHSEEPNLSTISSYVQKFIDDPTNMVKPSVAGDGITSFAENVLQPMVVDFEANKKKWWAAYQSAKLTLRNLNQLRLLYAIDSAVKELNAEEGRFQLSNTQNLLKAFIQDCDSPFIYEKIGSYMRYIMIDEFQDTSRMQWDNFKVLLFDNLSNNDSRNLIVGDVKQSIYRWRGGDWQLLNNIREEFSGNDHRWDKSIHYQPLGSNYRSSQRIVEFNNYFFREAVKFTLDELQADEINDHVQLQQAYEGHAQEVTKKNDAGYVHIELYNASGDDLDDAILGSMLGHVDELISNGISENDIAILVRNNDYIAEIADFFMRERPEIKIVSGEAFLLESSPAVNILIDALTLLLHPDDDLTRYTLATTYAKQVLKKTEDSNELFLVNDVNTLLPERFVDNASLIQMPLTDLVETLCDIFSLHSLDNQGAYISRFNDLLSEYVFNYSSDLRSFLKAWEDSLHTQKIQSDIFDGIRLLSIHKSKGLEFKHVIIPYCHWRMDHSTTIWCENIQQEPYCRLPVIPIDAHSSKSLYNTIFEDFPKKENLQNAVDNMNLLYVAFTRAEDSLFVVGAKKYGRSRVIEQFIHNLPEELSDAIVQEDDNVLSFEWGTMPTSDNKPKHQSTGNNNIFEVTETPYPIQHCTYTSPLTFMQSNKSKEFIESLDEEEDTHSTNYIQLGNILHNLFANIRTEEDIEPRLRELEFEGVLYDDYLTPDSIRNRIRKALSSPVVKEWFSNKWTLFNECTILVPEPSTHSFSQYRPDRVMEQGDKTIVVDFKFGTPRREHAEQVRQYMSLIRQMGRPDVKGYLWYVMLDKIEEL